MDDLKYLIYWLYKSIHVGYVYSLKHHNKLKQLWFLWMRQCGDARPAADQGSHVVPARWRAAAGLGWAAWDSCSCRTPLSLQRGSLGVVGLGMGCLPECLLLSWKGCVLPACCRSCLRMKLHVTAWAELTAANIKKKSCCRQCPSAPRLMLWCLLIPTQGRLVHGMDKSPWERKLTFFWFELMCCQLPAWSWECVWKEAAREQQDCPICGCGKQLVQLHCKVEVCP